MFDVVIPGYKEKYWDLIAIIRHFQPNARVTLIDNGNRPHEYERPNPNYRWVRLEENIGFVKATNAGIALSTAPYIVLMNDDTMVYGNIFDKMRLCIEKDSSVGIVGAALSGRMQHDLDNAERDAKECTTNFKGEFIACDMVPFTCAMIKREVINKVGYLDESFGVGYGEDDEYCHRVKQMGFKIGIARDAFCIHRGSQTFTSLYTPGQIAELKAKNLGYYKQKWSIIE